MSKNKFRELNDIERIHYEAEILKDKVYNDWYRYLSLKERNYELERSETLIYNANQVIEELKESPDKTSKILSAYNDLVYAFSENSAMAIMAVVLIKILNSLDEGEHITDSKYKDVLGVLYKRMESNTNCTSFMEGYFNKNTFPLSDYPVFEKEDPFCMKVINENTEHRLDETRLSKLDEIVEILRRGNWKEPATTENVVQLLNTVFGKDLSLLDDEDILLCEKMWSLVERGRGVRINVVSANLAGYFAELNLLKGTPKEINDNLFRNSKENNNINKGRKSLRSTAFNEVVPFLDKYVSKIIRKN